MKAIRPVVTAMVGLLLLVQGVAVAANPVSLKAAASVSDLAKAPCHTVVDDKASKTCCSSDCTDMSACSFGHIAASSLAQLPQIALTTQRFAPLQANVLIRPPQFLLRPPIALHA